MFYGHANKAQVLLLLLVSRFSQTNCFMHLCFEEMDVVDTNHKRYETSETFSGYIFLHFEDCKMRSQ